MLNIFYDLFVIDIQIYENFWICSFITIYKDLLK